MPVYYLSEMEVFETRRVFYGPPGTVGTRIKADSAPSPPHTHFAELPVRNFDCGGQDRNTG